MMLVRVAGRRGCGDVAHRRVLGGGVVLGDHDHRARSARGRSARSRTAACAASPIMLVGDEVEGDGRDHAGDDQAAVERVHDLAAVARLDEEAADDRGDDRDAAQHQRVEHGVAAERRRAASGRRAASSRRSVTA